MEIRNDIKTTIYEFDDIGVYTPMVIVTENPKTEEISLFSSFRHFGTVNFEYGTTFECFSKKWDSMTELVDVIFGNYIIFCERYLELMNNEDE